MHPYIYDKELEKVGLCITIIGKQMIQLDIKG